MTTTGALLRGGGITVTSSPALPDGISDRRVTPDYQRALTIPLRNGRLFDATDRKGGPLVVIISDSAAAKYFPGENPLGRTLPLDEVRTVVGVVGDVHQASLETEPLREAYVPIAQARVSGGDLVVRTAGNPYDVLPAGEAALFAGLPGVPLLHVRTMEELIAGPAA